MFYNSAGSTRRFICAFLITIFTGSVTAALNGDKNTDYIFEQVQQSGGPQPRYINYSTISRWPGSTVEWWYNPLDQPFDTQTAVDAISAAATSWETFSGVKFVYRGTTSQALSNASDDKLVIGWLEDAVFQARFGDYSAYAYIWWSGGNVVDGEISLNSTKVSLADDLQALVTHEWGHIIGINHSNRLASIMYANPYHTYQYQMTPRTDDVQAAQAFYPLQSGRVELTVANLLGTTTTAVIVGSVTDDNGSTFGSVFPSTAQLDIKSTINLNNSDLGRQGEFYAIVNYITPNSASSWYMLTPSGWIVWDLDIVSLVGIASPRTMNSTEVINVASGLTGLAGTFNVYTGYKSSGGLLVFSATPLVFSVTL